MKVHLNQIPEAGLHIEGVEPEDILDLDDELARSIEPVSYSLDLGVSEGSLFGTGVVRAAIEYECVTCLERFRYPLELDGFAFQIDPSGSDVVDLTPIVREDILLALPAHPHCDWDGTHACKGVRIASFGNVGGGEQGGHDPNAWGALDQLKIKKSN